MNRRAFLVALKTKLKNITASGNRIATTDVLIVKYIEHSRIQSFTLVLLSRAKVEHHHVNQERRPVFGLNLKLAVFVIVAVTGQEVPQ
jgi:hypothetical protein